jgi:hypothetical protein
MDFPASCRQHWRPGRIAHGHALGAHEAQVGDAQTADTVRSQWQVQGTDITSVSTGPRPEAVSRSDEFERSKLPPAPPMALVVGASAHCSGSPT